MQCISYAAERPNVVSRDEFEKWFFGCFGFARALRLDHCVENYSALRNTGDVPERCDFFTATLKPAVGGGLRRGVRK